MNRWNEPLTIFDRDAWIRGFILHRASEYLTDGGNSAKLIQNRRAIGDLIAGATSGIPTDENGIHEALGRSWIEAGGSAGDWYREFDQLLWEVVIQ